MTGTRDSDQAGGAGGAWGEEESPRGQQVGELVRFHADDIERLADRIADRLAARIADELRRQLAAPELINAGEAARMLGLTRGAIYRRARQLGGMRVGNGPNAPWRFDRERLLAAMDTCSAGRESAEQSGEADRPPVRASRRRTSAAHDGDQGCGFPLLPVRGL